MFQQNTKKVKTKNCNYTVNFSHNGTYMVTTDKTFHVNVIKSSQWPPKEVFSRENDAMHKDKIKSCCFINDESMTVTGCKDGYIKIWDI